MSTKYAKRKKVETILGVGSTGLDDGPYLPGKAPRKKPAPKTPEELRVIRAKAWETRRRVQKVLAAESEGGEG